MIENYVKAGFFVGGFIAGGALGVTGMWLVASAARIIERNRRQGGAQ